MVWAQILFELNILFVSRLILIDPYAVFNIAYLSLDHFGSVLRKSEKNVIDDLDS